MKKITLIGAMVLTAIIGYTAYFIYDFGKGFEPQILRGPSARSAINNFFIKPIPDSAHNLFFRHEGFQDSSYHIAMTIEPHDAWKFIEMYCGKKKKDFTAAMHSNPGYTEFSPDWSLGILKKPYILEVSGKRYLQVIIYDEESKRLLVHVSTS